MKLKNLFTCTVTGLLLCTSCIKDEAPNAEADILNCILPAEMLTGTDIDYNRPYDKSLNAYPIYIEVNNGTDLTRLAPTFELTEGASIEPANGSTQNFTPRLQGRRHGGTGCYHQTAGLSSGASTGLYPYSDDCSHRSMVQRISSLYTGACIQCQNTTGETGTTTILLLV